MILGILVLQKLPNDGREMSMDIIDCSVGTVQNTLEHICRCKYLLPSIDVDAEQQPIRSVRSKPLEGLVRVSGPDFATQSIYLSPLSVLKGMTT